MTDTKWLLYDELSEALGIKPDSARRLVSRKKWPHKPNNDGRSLIAVPAEYLERPAVTDIGKDAGDGGRPDNSADISHSVGILSAHIERLQADLETLKGERDQDRARVAALALQAAQAEALRMTAEDLRMAAEDLRADRDKWQEIAVQLAASPPRPQTVASYTPAASRGWWPFRRSA